MSTYTDVKKQIATMKEKVRPHGPIVKQTLPFDFSVLTPDEQGRLQAVLDQVEPKYRWIETGKYAGQLLLDDLSGIDIDTLDLWSCLIEALKRQDTQRIQAIRDRLRYSPEDVITLFASLSENEGDPGHSPGGSSYQSLLTSLQEGKRIACLDNVWLWLVKAGKVDGLFHPDMLQVLR